MASTDNIIAALKRERAGYVSRGLTDRVDQVDAEITRLREESSEPADQPEGRTASPQQTADADPGPGTGDGSAQTAATAKKTAAKKTTPPPAK